MLPDKNVTERGLDLPHDAKGALLGKGKIKHIIFIVQENRSPDDLFNGLPGADTVTSGANSAGSQTPLRKISMTAPYDLSHSNNAWNVEYDGRPHGRLRLASTPTATLPAASANRTASTAHMESCRRARVQPYFVLSGGVHVCRQDVCDPTKVRALRLISIL